MTSSARSSRGGWAVALGTVHDPALLPLSMLLVDGDTAVCSLDLIRVVRVVDAASVTRTMDPGGWPRSRADVGGKVLPGEGRTS